MTPIATFRGVLHALFLLLAVFVAACQAPQPQSPADRAAEINERHRRLYSDADLPRQIGTVENIGVQLPVVSPDGRYLLYLRTDQPAVNPMTLLGSTDPADTPPNGTLSVWLRPTRGKEMGHRVSSHRWSHSAVWSDSGSALAYVANTPQGSIIIHHDVLTGTETELGVEGQVNCLPVFDGSDGTLLFCSGPSAAEPFSVWRQSVGDAQPVELTPGGADSLLPVRSDGAAQVLCAQADGENLRWVQAGPQGASTLASSWGFSGRPGVLQTWAGIASPLSPDRESVMFYDIPRSRVAILHVPDRLVRRHRQGSIAACWMEADTVALATADGVFVVNTETGMSTSVFSGQWIPMRFVPSERRLILLGQETPRRFAIWEVVFRPLAKASK